MIAMLRKPPPPLAAAAVVWLASAAAGALVASGIGAHAAEPVDHAAQARQPAAEKSAAGAVHAKWLNGLAAGYKQALATRSPLLVRVGGESCPWCRLLDAEIEKPQVQAALAGWTLVEIDADKQPDDAREMGVSAIPALRIVAPTGKVLASHDGYLTADALKQWLNKERPSPAALPDEELLAAAEKPTAVAVVRLVRHLSDRDSAVREAAFRRLRPYPDVARPQVVKAFCEGNLNAQLAALELLAAWKGPVGPLDPWRPDTMTDERKEALRRWAAEPLPPNRESANAASPSATPQKLDAEQLAIARAELARLSQAGDAEVEAICERLARFGPALLPEIAAGQPGAVTDLQRSRLLALRYRLLVSDDLALRWPGGMMLLASLAPEERHRAAVKLVELAGPDDQPLLAELFRDSDPLLRELALRGLQHVGGKQAAAALVALLADPEPNVRAAVLKQLAEQPDRELIPKVAEYVKREKDADLVVHAIRFLSAAGGVAAVDPLVELLKHKSWQVRAEAAEALNKMLASGGDPFGGGEGAGGQALRARTALADLLDDSDPFVVSKALDSLKGNDASSLRDPAMVKRLMGVARKHPTLIAHVIRTLGERRASNVDLVPYLREFAKHPDATARIAAIEALCNLDPADLGDDLAKALSDGDAMVRTATADAIFKRSEQLRRSASAASESGGAPQTRASAAEPASASPLEGLLKAMFGSSSAQPAAEKKAVAAASSGPTVALGKAVSVTAAAADSATPLDGWLAAYAAGEQQPLWSNKIALLLEKMLAAPAPKERAAAGLALASLGRPEKGRAAILAAAKISPDAFARAARMLPWLVWEQRAPFYQELLKLSPDNVQHLTLLAEALAETHDPRAIDLLWNLLADPQTAPRRASLVCAAIDTSLLRNHYSLNLQSSPELGQLRIEALRQLRPKAAAGPPWQRLVAAALLLRVSGDEAASAAETLAADKSVPEAVHREAFQIELAAISPPRRRKLALEALTDKNVGRRNLALGYLAEGSSFLQSLPGETRGSNLYLPIPYDDPSPGYGSEPIVPEAPAGLQAEPLKLLLEDVDPAVRARAGYLLALSGDRRGLAPLLDHWRNQDQNQKDDAVGNWDRLAYRAIAALDDEQDLPTLKQIYAHIGKENYAIREFYWTIRTMTGPAVLAFRGQIRREVGMERLQ